MTNLVSIIIPLYNVESYVTDCLRSVFNQTYPYIEFILVDDCSTDNTMHVVDRFLLEYANGRNIKIINHIRNRGLSAARNTGIQAAKGEFIFFVDSDDEITSDCIQRHLQAITSIDADFTVANVQLKGARSIHIRRVNKRIMSYKPVITYFQRKWSVSAWNKLYRREFLMNNKISFVEGLIFEDILWSFRLATLAKQIALIDEQTYIYKIRSNSLTTNNVSTKKIDSFLYILDTIQFESANKLINMEYKSDYEKFISFMSFTCALQLFKINISSYKFSSYYNLLRGYTNGFKPNPYTLLLSLPSILFQNIIGPLYKLYKNAFT